MKSVESIPDLIESPCIQRCCLDTQDVCIGCFRSLNEITAWSKASRQEQLEILARAKQRRRLSTCVIVDFG
jgi:predicted Fe-S protein YdhL (DUF1289 family)